LGRVNRQLGDLLDVHDAVPGSYTLEVSSPGVNRRLRKADQFQRYIGQIVRVRLAMPRDGRRNFRGTLTHVSDDGITVEQDEGVFVLPFAEIAQANHEAELE